MGEGKKEMKRRTMEEKAGKTVQGGGKEGGKEGGRERERKGGKEGGREGGRERERKGGREGGREGERRSPGRHRSSCGCHIVHNIHLLIHPVHPVRERLHHHW